MLPKNVKEWFASIGLDPEKLVEAVTSSQEVEIAVPAGKLYSDEQITEMKNNVKRGYQEAFPEIWGKELNTELALGLDSAAAKDRNKLIEAIKAKAVKDAGIEPTKRVEELQASIKKLQEEVIPAKEREANEWRTKFTERQEFDQYAALVPKNANSFLTTEEHVNRLRKEIKFGENGAIIDVNTGNVVKDDMERPIKASDYVSGIYSKREGWLQPEAPTQAAPVHHSTNRGSGMNNGKGKTFDFDKAMADVSSRYDMTTLDGKRAAQAEITRIQTEAYKSQGIAS